MTDKCSGPWSERYRRQLILKIRFMEGGGIDSVFFCPPKQLIELLLIRSLQKHESVGECEPFPVRDGMLLHERT